MMRSATGAKGVTSAEHRANVPKIGVNPEHKEGRKKTDCSQLVFIFSSPRKAMSILKHYKNS